MSRNEAEQIPPKWIVRTVAAVLLPVGILLMCIAVINLSTLGALFAIGVFAAGLGLAAAAATSLYTGNPEWILLNLILPG